MINMVGRLVVPITPASLIRKRIPILTIISLRMVQVMDRTGMRQDRTLVPIRSPDDRKLVGSIGLRNKRNNFSGGQKWMIDGGENPNIINIGRNMNHHKSIDRLRGFTNVVKLDLSFS